MMMGCLVVELKGRSLGLGLPATIEARQHDPGGNGSRGKLKELLAATEKAFLQRKGGEEKRKRSMEKKGMEEGKRWYRGKLAGRWDGRSASRRRELPATQEAFLKRKGERKKGYRQNGMEWNGPTEEGEKMGWRRE
jgi:hypothetical protein